MKGLLITFFSLYFIAGTLTDPIDYDFEINSYSTEDPNCATNDLMPYEGDCTKYWACNEGIKYLMECPPGLYFNPTTKLCDFPDQSGCVNSTLI